MKTSTKLRCVLCVRDSHPTYPQLCIQQSVGCAGRTGTGVIREGQHGSVYTYFSASSQYGNVTHSSAFASVPPSAGYGSCLAQLWNSNGFCGSRGIQL